MSQQTVNWSQALFGWNIGFQERCLPCSWSLARKFENVPLCSFEAAHYFFVRCCLEIRYGNVNMKLKCSQHLMEMFSLAALQESVQAEEKSSWRVSEVLKNDLQGFVEMPCVLPLLLLYITFHFSDFLFSISSQSSESPSSLTKQVCYRDKMSLSLFLSLSKESGLFPIHCV